jgi:hypothetical protein
MLPRKCSGSREGETSNKSILPCCSCSKPEDARPAPKPSKSLASGYHSTVTAGSTVAIGATDSVAIDVAGTTTQATTAAAGATAQHPTTTKLK